MFDYTLHIEHATTLMHTMGGPAVHVVAGPPTYDGQMRLNGVGICAVCVRARRSAFMSDTILDACPLCSVRVHGTCRLGPPPYACKACQVWD